MGKSNRKIVCLQWNMLFLIVIGLCCKEATAQEKFISEKDSLCRITQFLTEKTPYYTGWEMTHLERTQLKLPDTPFFVAEISQTIPFATYKIGRQKVYFAQAGNVFFLKYKKKFKRLEFNTAIKLTFIGYLLRDNGTMEFKFRVQLPKCTTFLSLNDDKDDKAFSFMGQYDHGPKD